MFEAGMGKRLAVGPVCLVLALLCPSTLALGWPKYVLTLVGLIWTLLTPLLFVVSPLISYRSHPMLRDIDWVWDDDSVKLRLGGLTTVMSWASFKSIRKRGGFLVFRTSDAVIYTVPISALCAADVERLRALISAKMEPSPGRLAGLRGGADESGKVWRWSQRASVDRKEFAQTQLPRWDDDSLIVASYCLSLGKYFRGHTAQAFESRLVRCYAFGPIPLVIGILGSIHGWPTELLLLVGIISTVSLLIILLVQPLVLYSRHAMFRRPTCCKWSAQGVEVRADGYETACKWESLKSVRERGGFWLFYLSGTCAIIVPVSALGAADAESLRTLISAKMGADWRTANP